MNFVWFVKMEYYDKIRKKEKKLFYKLRYFHNYFNNGTKLTPVI